MNGNTQAILSHDAEDYRESHLDYDHASFYNAAFRDNPYRRMIWKLEKSILDDILSTYCNGLVISHLDFACGTGRVLKYLAKHASKSVGVDVSDNMVKVARENGVTAEIIVGDLTTKDVIGNRTFNLITVFRFFPNAQPELRKAAMEAVATHLDDYGYLVFNNHKNSRSLRIYIAKALRRYSGGKTMSTQDVDTLVKANGLEVVRTYYTSIFPASDSRTLLPIGLLRLVEAVFQKVPLVRRLGENTVFVCRKAPCSAAQREGYGHEM